MKIPILLPSPVPVPGNNEKHPQGYRRNNSTFKVIIDDDDVYLDKLQTRSVKKSILYM
jgi:hypothetical protein